MVDSFYHRRRWSMCQITAFVTFVEIMFFRLTTLSILSVSWVASTIKARRTSWNKTEIKQFYFGFISDVRTSWNKTETKHWNCFSLIGIFFNTRINEAETILKLFQCFVSVFTARCTLVQNAVLRSHVVCPSVCLSVTLVNCDHMIDWLIEPCFTSPPTQYRLHGRRFLQVKRPNQQYQSTEGESCKGK